MFGPRHTCLATYGVVGHRGRSCSSKPGLLLGLLLPGETLDDPRRRVQPRPPRRPSRIRSWRMVILMAGLGAALGGQLGYAIGRGTGEALHDRPDGRIYKRRVPRAHARRTSSATAPRRSLSPASCRSSARCRARSRRHRRDARPARSPTYNVAERRGRGPIVVASDRLRRLGGVLDVDAPRLPVRRHHLLPGGSSRSGLTCVASRENQGPAPQPQAENRGLGQPLRPLQAAHAAVTSRAKVSKTSR